MKVVSRLTSNRRSVVYGVPVAVFAACAVVGLVGSTDSPVLRVLMVATALAAPFMYWSPGRYATVVLITSAWLGRAVSALYGLDGYDDRADIVVAGAWPALWYLAMVAIFTLHVVRVEDRVLGV